MSRATHKAPWSKCNYCSKSEFSDSLQFVRHLREVHCSQEGGSFVCHYGDNNICYSLPVVGVNDIDYEKHVYQHHTLALPSTTNSGLPLEDKRPQEKWTVYSASQFLPSVLNDPTKSKPRDFFTKTWGDSFVETTEITDSRFLPAVPQGLFDQYLRRYGKRHKKHLRLVELSSRPQGHFELIQNFPHLKIGKFDRQRSDVNTIPKIFLSASFNLSNVATFNEVFPHIAGKTDNGAACTEPCAEQSNRLLQEKLSHYLDLVEVQIAQQVSQKSEAFFRAMTSHDAIMEQLSHNVSLVRALREKLGRLDSTLATDSLKILKQERLRSNYVVVHRKLRLMATVLQTQPTIQLLLSGADYTGALELMDATQELLAEELSGIHSLRHLSSELREMERVIDTLMAEEMESLAVSLMQGEASAETRLPAVIAGMARRCHPAASASLEAAAAAALRSHQADVSGTESGEAWVGRVGSAVKRAVTILGRVGTAASVMERLEPLAEAAVGLKQRTAECAADSVASLLAAGWPPGRSAPAHLAALAAHVDRLDSASALLIPSIPASARAALNVQAGKCLARFHAERAHKVLLVLESEQWRRADVPAGFQALAEGIAERGDFRAASGASSGPPRFALEIGGSKYAVPAAALLLLDTVAEYCAFAEDFPAGAEALLRHASDLLTQFNARCYKLVLAGGAVSERTGLRIITAAHLALVLRTLDLVGWLVPHVRLHFASLGAARSPLDSVLGCLRGHAKDVRAKLVEIVRSSLAPEMRYWEPKPPVPSKSVQAVLRHLRKFHDAIRQLLPPDIVQELFLEVVAIYKVALRERLTKYNITNDGLPQHGLVNLELLFFSEELKRLEVIPPEKLELSAMNDIWADSSQ